MNFINSQKEEIEEFVKVHPPPQQDKWDIKNEWMKPGKVHDKVWDIDILAKLEQKCHHLVYCLTDHFISQIDNIIVTYSVM